MHRLTTPAYLTIGVVAFLMGGVLMPSIAHVLPRMHEAIAWTPTVGGTESSPQQTDPALVAAIQAYVDSQGRPYVGDCRTAPSPPPRGAQCSSVQMLTDGVANVLVGLAFSDSGQWHVFVRNTDATWWPFAQGAYCFGGEPDSGITGIGIHVGDAWIPVVDGLFSCRAAFGG